MGLFSPPSIVVGMLSGGKRNIHNQGYKKI